LSAEDVAEILGRLDDAGIWYCVEGGWGVDALLGEQTREHVDIDLAVRLDEVERLCSVLEEFERDEREWPSSLGLADERGRRVDAHPLTFDENGDGWQAKQGGGAYRWPAEHLDARGRIGGREVHCITPELQVRWHEHEGFDDVDWADMRALAERFGLPPPGESPGFVAPKRKLHFRDDPV
jgi:lincosamide nucleotidyltransferase A/C/D/E